MKRENRKSLEAVTHTHTHNTFKERIKEKRGITLVALVITIIILIILATVAINFAFGSNGLIRRAEDARDYYSNDTAYTDESMTNVESYLDELIESTNAKNTLVQALKDGRIAVGDYVSYTPDAHEPVTVGTDETGYTNQDGDGTETDQTFSQDPNTTWRVLGLSEDGEHVLLTTGSPIKKGNKNSGVTRSAPAKEDPYLVLESSAGAANCVTVLNKISGLYHNSTLAEETRSITIEDIERTIEGETITVPGQGELKIEEITVTYPQEGESGTGEVTLTMTVTEYDAEGNSESQTITEVIGETTLYSSYAYKVGDYTLTNPPQIVIAEQNSEVETYSMARPDPEPELETTPIGQSINADGYMFRYNIFADLASYSRKFDMLFTGTTGSDGSKSYWLASPGVVTNSDCVFFGPGFVSAARAYSGYDLFYSDGGWRAVGLAVRPVVVLKSNVTIDQVPKIEDQEEDSWEGYRVGEYYNELREY